MELKDIKFYLRAIGSILVTLAIAAILKFGHTHILFGNVMAFQVGFGGWLLIASFFIRPAATNGTEVE
jgi:hypothetical protein